MATTKTAATFDDTTTTTTATAAAPVTTTTTRPTAGRDLDNQAMEFGAASLRWDIRGRSMSTHMHSAAASS